MPRYLVTRTWVVDAGNMRAAIDAARVGDHLDLRARRVQDDFVPPITEDVDGAWSRELSPRELQVVRLAGLGKSTREMTFELGITPSTLQRHFNNVSKVMNLVSARRALIVETARRAGVI